MHVVATPEQADCAIVRLSTPFQPMGDSFLAATIHPGGLDFKGRETDELIRLQDVPHDSKAPLFPFGAGLSY